MQRKIALKRLSSSDLTLFEYHYRNTSGTKQKAINLDSAVFVDVLFPGLPNRLDVIRDRVIVTLAIYGPGGAGSHSITRKILKQQKNWRLNGELISNPPEEPNRYNSLKKGDYAILDFAGDFEPHTARMYLVAQASPQDQKLHSALETDFGPLFASHKGMLDVDADRLRQLLNDLNLPAGYPVLDFIDNDALEDAAQGGFEGLSKLRNRRQARGVSREELGRARQNADQIGRLGEEILNAWLESKTQNESGIMHVWDSDINAVAPYDFTLLQAGKPMRRLEAKSTSGGFANPIHISLAELNEMAQESVPYDLYRLHSINDTSARLRIAQDLKGFARDVLKSLETLPRGVTADSVSVKPDTLPFGEEIIIELLDTNEGDVVGDLLDN